MTLEDIGGTRNSTGQLDIVGSKALLRVLDRPLRPPIEKVAGVLSSRRGAIVPRDDIISEIWDECASGGPLSADALVGLYVAVLRRAGLPITTFRARGYSVGLLTERAGE
jgi:DNA-binding response OmpR family regulator